MKVTIKQKLVNAHLDYIGLLLESVSAALKDVSPVEMIQIHAKNAASLTFYTMENVLIRAQYRRWEISRVEHAKVIKFYLN